MPGPISTLASKTQSAPAVVAFLSIGVAQATIMMVLQGIVVVQWQAFLKPTVLQVPRGYTVPTNFAIFLFGFLFQLVFMCDAIRLRNTAQAMLSCVLNAGFLPLAIFQRADIKDAETSLRGSSDVNGDSLVYLDQDPWSIIGNILFAMPIIIGVFTLLLVISVWYLKQFFSWQSYRNVGADSKLRKMRLMYQIFAMLAKMDIYFIICFEIIMGVTKHRAQGIEFIIHMVILGIAVVIIGMSMIWAKSENRIGMIASISAYLAGLAYLIYMLVTMHTSKRFGTAVNALTAFASMAIFFILLTTIFGIICLRNFWGGLKEHLGKHEEGWDHQSRMNDMELETRTGFQYQNLESKLDLDS
ncbi:hypothetical protein BKA59DRAFT_546523 [Fusarium tricinctum]|uniref:Uncharacterized protein n=2 Tax=Fusarium tricinctum species complex TaxID=679429 RepID=A0A8K0RX55_9HYPO|nr:hypothetical protein BKA59DRAFT_546523 [Fusarium tricinctum]